MYISQKFGILACMTRINASIKPANLCDQHLLAEHREIVRVRHAQNSKAKAPDKFRLGTGHVIFFKDKLGFIKKRYELLHKECKKRGFNVTDFSKSFDGFDVSGNYKPTDEDNKIIIERLTIVLKRMKRIRFKGIEVEYNEAVKMLKR